MPVHYERQGPVAVVTLDNPPLNLLDPTMLKELHDAYVELAGDPTVHVGVLTAAGDRAFCAGDDLYADHPVADDPRDELMRELNPQHRRATAGPAWEWESDLLVLERYTPVVAAVRGWCLGAGLAQLLSLSDVRIAGRSAQFGLPEIRYGMGGGSGMARLARWMPRGAALALALTGEPIDADEAHRLHLVNEVVDDDHVLDRATELAERIAGHPPLAVRIEMEAFARAAELGPVEAVRFAERLYQLQRLALGETDRESYEAARAARRERHEPPGSTDPAGGAT